MYRYCIAFAVYSNPRATMDIMLPSPMLEEPFSGQSHNLLNKQLLWLGSELSYKYLKSEDFQ